MALLIPGRRAPGKYIDVYLEPLIDELKELWENGVHTFDIINKEYFTMRAAVFWTINDFSAYGTIFGYSTQGEYDGTTERRLPPIILTGDEILDKLKGVWKCRPGKNDKIIKDDKQQMNDACYENKTNWKRKSVFWELEYWPKLKLRHNLDVMHIEKNICDSVVGTIFSIDGKSKDTENARLDLQDLNIRKQLHMKKKGNNWELGHLKKYVKNKARPEGSIAEGNVIIEALNFCSMYLRGIETRFNLPDRNPEHLGIRKQSTISIFNVPTRPFGRQSSITLTQDEQSQIQCEHRLFLQSKGILDIDQVQKNEFSTWFENKIKKMNETSSGEAQEDLYAIAMQLDYLVEVEYDGKICDFYGVIDEIWEVHYLYWNKVILFKCSWYNTNESENRMYTEYHFTSINTNSKWFEDEPFVIANQVSSVFYLDDLKKNKDWKVVQKVNHWHIWDIPSKPEDGEVDDEDPTIINSEAYQEESSNDIDANFDSTTNHNDQVQNKINNDDTDEEALLNDSEETILSDESD
ncbi:uncharacterized protein LOC133825514 [Humulus lupulus]|uniref:uncharacterized protein LOC133825514 n=1 Tax=Humulus lupulus TaxID=3486 RepID=UPI002B40C888|nr:uncharacterized protein LOC133825514 [Humulus lupulus]